MSEKKLHTWVDVVFDKHYSYTHCKIEIAPPSCLTSIEPKEIREGECRYVQSVLYIAPFDSNKIGKDKYRTEWYLEK